MDTPSTRRSLNRLIGSVSKLRQQCLDFERANRAAVAAAAPCRRKSARNLLHYLALRQHDIRGLQEDLSALGLSSLGRLEAHTMATLDAVLKTLHRLAEKAPPEIGKDDAPVGFSSGPKLLREHAESLLGPPPANHPVRVMVTMPTEAASDPALVRNLLGAGMNIMRINCAHDGPDAWAGMVANLRSAERSLGKSCKVMADLSGPKLRTGRIEGLGHITKFKPRRICDGTVVSPARIWLTPAGSSADISHGPAERLIAVIRNNSVVDRRNECTPADWDRRSGKPIVSSPIASAPSRSRTNPAFAAKVEDVVGLDMHQPAHAVVVSIDEKSQIQALPSS